MSHFLDERPFNAAKTESVRLTAIVSEIYFDAAKAQRILRKVREDSGLDDSFLPVQDINWSQAASDFWPDILEQAANLMILRGLVMAVLQDRNARAYKDEIEAWLKAPESDAAAPVGAVGHQTPTAESFLTDTLWDLIGRMLADHVLSKPNPTDALSAISTEGFARGLKLGDDPNENLRKVVNDLKTSDVEGSRPILLRALRGLLKIDEISQTPEAGVLEQEIATIRVLLKNLKPGDPLDQYLLPSGDVFMDRSRLRTGLRGLLGNQLVLVVRGPEDSGKSYSERLIRHLAMVSGLNLAMVTHDDATTPEQFIDFLKLDIDANLEKFKASGNLDAEKWARHACKWLIKQAQSRSPNWWFVVDGYNRRRSNQQIKDLIGALALTLLAQTEGQYRLVLLDYDGSIPVELLNRTRVEDLNILREVDVREFFTDFFSVPRSGVLEGEPVDSHIDISVTKVWESADSRHNDLNEPEPFMELLNQEVQDIVNAYAD